ncbi:hypothetical protein RJT34_20141 [Clitoria ternatea]|uniref:Uncharacterized protein n=1 Tax=Clitoria ternatea TaxID=43366 RepID=A0AAN9ISB6_CLITE
MRPQSSTPSPSSQMRHRHLHVSSLAQPAVTATVACCRSPTDRDLYHYLVVTMCSPLGRELRHQFHLPLGTIKTFEAIHWQIQQPYDLSTSPNLGDGASYDTKRVKPRHFLESFAKRPPRDMDDIRDLANKYINLKELKATSNKQSRSRSKLSIK